MQGIMLTGEQPTEPAPADFVIATYREIADRFGLGSPDAARVRSKRSGWEREPSNHPLDPARIRVPLTAWERVAPPRTSSNDPPRARSKPVEDTPNSDPPINGVGSDFLKSVSD